MGPHRTLTLGGAALFLCCFVMMAAGMPQQERIAFVDDAVESEGLGRWFFHPHVCAGREGCDDGWYVHLSWMGVFISFF